MMIFALCIVSSFFALYAVLVLEPRKKARMQELLDKTIEIEIKDFDAA